ncbi:MAG TPA: FG-GAP-like repeat-containing protein [Polyangia bacterium]
MSKQKNVGIVLALMGLWLPVACDHTLRTGKVGTTSQAQNPDGGCSTGLSPCGKGVFLQCQDLQNDPANCGTCANACVPGIACAAGACQQIACTASVTVTTKTLPETTGTHGGGPQGELLADVNCDGRPDLINWDGSGELQVALGEAGASFGEPSTYQIDGMLNLMVMDWNSDGCDDIYASHGDGAGVVWLGHPDGTLTLTAVAGDAGFQEPIAFADLNGDGIRDMVSGCSSDYGRPCVYLADSNGAFHAGSPLSAKRDLLSSGLVRDWNGDGFPDFLNTSVGDLSVYLNRGDGTFDDEMDCGVLVWAPLVVADFNHDGHMDIAYGMEASGAGVSVLMGMGGCQFQPMAEYLLSDQVFDLVYTDLDGDGIQDLVALAVDCSVSLLRGKGDGTFNAAPLVTGGSCNGGGRLLVEDVGGDGKADVVVAGFSLNGYMLVPQNVQVLENTCP